MIDYRYLNRYLTHYLNTIDGYTECLRNLCSKFPLKMFVGGVTKKRLFWSDIQITSGDTDENGSKKSKSNGEVKDISSHNVLVLQRIESASL